MERKLPRASHRPTIPGDSDNGCLSIVPGGLVGAAVSLCPDARTADTDTVAVTIDGGALGTLKITCQRMRERRFGGWFWRAIRADRI